MHDRSVSDNGYTHRQILVIFAGLMLGMVLAALDGTIVATALPTITGDLGAPEHLAWVVTAYLLTTTISTPVYGKLGDLLGRKRLFQVAIAVFTVGSALCGIAGSMGTLIAARAVQGLGAGGLIVLGQAVIADVVTPRERGRYQGYFGAVFGAASVAGPLLGGFITDHASWRWVFTINLPLGLLALVVTTVVLPSSPRRPSVSIDYAGAALLSAAIAVVVLLTTLGGSELAWGSGRMLAMVAGAAVLLGGFVAVERRALDPILPLRLFRDRTFLLCTGISLVVGVTMLALVSFLPVFLQTVGGESATDSGLLLVPLLGGMLTASVASGRAVSATGRYRRFPILGAGLLTVAMALFATLDAGATRFESGCYMLLAGIGMGATMQVIVLAAQNAVPRDDLGVATASVNFFRSIGGSLGVAAFGALLNARLGGAVAGGTILGGDDVAALGAAERAAYLDGFAGSVAGTFLWGVPLTLVALGLAVALREVPLRGGPTDGEAAVAGGLVHG